MAKASRVELQMGIGIDIERVDRFRREMSSTSRFLSRTFTKREWTYCMSKADPSIHFAGVFAAKEAALKSIGGIHAGRTSIGEFKVSHGRDGTPRVGYSGSKAVIKAVKIQVSISHTSEIAVAAAFSVVRNGIAAR